MAPRYRTVAVIGSGPSGLSAVKALHDENVFDQIRVFERRDQVGGHWHYDPIPDVFPTPGAPAATRNAIPKHLPQFAPPAPEDTTARTGIHDGLDSNLGALAMAFTHTPFPEVNSALSVRQIGQKNPSRPYQAIAGYLQDLFRPFLHLVSLNTTVEKVEKVGEKWTLTLRQSGHFHRNQPAEYWWQEQFDAVIVASGHYNVPSIPDIPGLDVAVQAHPAVFEHSKSFRSADNYVDKKVIVVGGSISSSDLISDLHSIVRGPLYLSQRGRNEVLENVFTLPNVILKPTIQSIQPTATAVSVTFSDGSTVHDIDRIIFATGHRLSYPFLTPDPVTPSNRVAGLYQHIFKIGDPSLAFVGQVRAALSFRVYEYQAVAVARYFADHAAGSLPTPQAQDVWETERLKYKGPTTLFHEIKPDFKEYFDFLRGLAGPPVRGTTGYQLPEWEDKWGEQAFAILVLKDKYWKGIKDAAKAKEEGEEGRVKAKL